jgi:hypothetical protein
MRARIAALTAATAFAAACGGVGVGGAEWSPSAAGPREAKAPSAAAAPAPSAAPLSKEEEADRETRALVAAMLARVAKARGLPVKREVKSRELARPAMLERIRLEVEKDLPMDVVAYQGELLASLDLVPPEYDFIAGNYKLIEGQIAGFYTPDDGTMYLADDLGESEAEETLAHELVHALQDQSYPLEPMLKYAPGAGDRTSAVHSLIEGDATSAMLDVVAGSAFKVSETLLRRMLDISTTLSAAGSDTPRVLQASLTAPYSDGFAFVQQIRRRGGWKAVDAVWRALPETTEQLLHIDKLDAREQPLPVPPVPLDTLGSGFRIILDDVMGEQGLRIVLEEWARPRDAEQAAAGWGGDRYVVAVRDVPGDAGRKEIAVAWHLRMDTASDAAEVAAILKAHFSAGCLARRGFGPLVWKLKGDTIVIAAGPYERQGRTPKATGACLGATRWADAMLKGG